MAKIKKKTAIILIIVFSVILLAGGGLIYYFRKQIWGEKYSSELGVYYGKFGYAPVFGGDSLYIDYSDRFAAFQTEIESGMAEGATAEQKALAAYIIYRIGCLADQTALMKAKYYTGLGGAFGKLGTTEIGGNMNLNSTYYGLNYPLTVPASIDRMYDGTYQSYGDAEEYAQVPAGGIVGNNQNLIDLVEPALRMALPYARRNISTPDYKVTWFGESDSVKILAENSTGEFKEDKKQFYKQTAEEIRRDEAPYARVYGEDWGDPYGLTAHDITATIINPSTIVGDSVVITKETGIDLNDEPAGYYSVEFDIDCVSHRDTPESPTYLSELSFLDDVPGIINDAHAYFEEMKIKMSVFENGYFRTFGSVDKRVVAGKLIGADIQTTLTNDGLDAFCYDYDTIMQGFVNRWFGNKEQANLPASALPFYDRFSSFTPEGYGNYR
jgi:hypothetical protein